MQYLNYIIKYKTKSRDIILAKSEFKTGSSHCSSNLPWSTQSVTIYIFPLPKIHQLLQGSHTKFNH